MQAISWFSSLLLLHSPTKPTIEVDLIYHGSIIIVGSHTKSNL